MSERGVRRGCPGLCVPPFRPTLDTRRGCRKIRPRLPMSPVRDGVSVLGVPGVRSRNGAVLKFQMVM